MKSESYPQKTGFALCIAITIAIVAVLTSANSQESALLMGDFPAFYSLGKIVVNGQSANLYNLELQTQIQNQIWPGLAGGVLISVYPPPFALALSALCHFSPALAHLIYTSLSVLALLYSFLILFREAKLFSQAPFFILALLIANPFILIGSIGGQNTAFSLAILAAGFNIFFKAKNNSLLLILAGLILSLLLFKPQFGILVFLILLGLRINKACLGFIIGAIVHYFAGVILLGFSWPVIWLKSISFFSSVNYISNQDIHTSVPGFLNFLNSQIELIKPQTAGIVTWFALAVFALLYYQIIRRFSLKGNRDCFTIIWLAISAIPLIAPQTQFYDIGISVFSLYMICLRQSEDSKVLSLVSSLSLLSWISVLYREPLGAILFPLTSLAYFSACLYFFLIRKAVSARLS